MSVLDELQKTEFLNPASQWWYVDRRGALQTVAAVFALQDGAGEELSAAAAAATAGLAAEPIADVETALAAVGREAADGAPARILICGSLYLAGAVLAANGTPPE